MMRRTGIIVTTCLALVLAVSAGSAEAAATVEEVIAKHIKARGGANWDKIQSLRAEGQFTAFSEVAPFTLTKQRGDRYLLDHTQNAKKVVIASDGENAWWENHWFGTKATPLEGANLAAASVEFHFVSSLFDYKSLGYTAELIGETEYDDFPAIGIKLTLPDESEETWYLDPETYLEFARLSPGSDFGRPMEQRTFFDDFREVQGVKIPFYTETQWYTRDRVMQIDKIDFDVAVDSAMFDMPAPPGMGPILGMAGEWKIAVEQRPRPDAEFQASESTGKIQALLDRGLIRAETKTAQGNTILWDLAYDSAREKYRMTTINDRQPYINVLEGTRGEDGKVVLTNLDTGTTLEMFGLSIHSRMSIFDVTDDGFRVEFETSIDGGENWAVMAKQAYARAGAEEQNQ